MKTLDLIVTIVATIVSLFIWLLYISALFYQKNKYSSSDKISITKKSDDEYYTYNNKFLAVIAAHNEEKVISKCVRSLLYAGMDTVAVVSDSCTDNTAIRAFEEGALIFNVDFHNKDRSIKYAIEKLAEFRDFDGVFIFDADNVVNRDFLINASPYLYNNFIQFRHKNKNNTNTISRLTAFMYSLSFAIQRGMSVLFGFGAFSGSAMYIKYSENLFDFCNYRVVSLVDDFENTLYLSSIRHRVTYIDDPEVLCFNESPSNWIVAFYQRLRWTRGYAYLLFKKFGMFFCAPVYLAFPLSNLLIAFSFVYVLISPVNYLCFTLIFTLPLLIFVKTPDYISFIDVIIIPFYFLFLMASSLVALFTYTRNTWYHTPHSSDVVSKKISQQ